MESHRTLSAPHFVEGSVEALVSVPISSVQFRRAYPKELVWITFPGFEFSIDLWDCQP